MSVDNMGGWAVILFVACACLIPQVDGRKRYSDLFAHKHPGNFPPIPGWYPDGNPWDDYLYPPFGANDLTRRRGKPVTARLTSDSPAIKGSCITFTAALEFPPCQKEDAREDLVFDEHCEDGYVYTWSSWLDDYGFGKCTDLAQCNVFPDGKPFPQSNDWGRKGYVYVWHTMGQYFQTCGGSSSSLTLNTTDLTLGAGMMEVMVYRVRERKKYSPTASDNGVFFVTDKIPLAVELSQKAAQNLSEKVFVRGADVVFKVLVHDPGNFLKTAAAVDFIWDFRDGNQLVTHSNVATHAYCAPGNVTVKLTVEAAFRVPCPPPPTPTPTSLTPPRTTVAPATHAITGKVKPTPAALPKTTAVVVPVTTITAAMTTVAAAMTTAYPTTESLPPTTDAGVTPKDTPAPPDVSAPPQRPLGENECFHYMYGSFEQEIFITEGKLTVLSVQANEILEVSASKVSNTTVNFLVKCLGRQVKNIVCDDVPPSAACQVTLNRTFLQPGTYCVNITLEGGASLTLASTHITIEAGGEVSHPEAAEVVLSASAVLVAIFALIAFMVYKRYKVYRPVRRSVTEVNGEGGVRVRVGRLRGSLFPADEERSHLLNHRPPL